MFGNCKNCKFYEPSESSYFGGWCLAGAHLHDDKNVIYGVDKEDGCNDWEEKKDG